MRPVVTGINTPIENRINSILDVVRIIPIVGRDLGRIETDVSSLLDDAAAGAPITLSVFDRNGNAIAPSDRCDIDADSFSLASPRGLAIGGNRITGLGAGGVFASAADANAIALGNGASTGAMAIASVAIGQNATASAANSVALGAGARAARGPQLAYAAFGLEGDQVSAGEVSVGAGGARRQITSLAPGSAPDDAVNVAQLQGVAGRIDGVAAGLAELDTRVSGRVDGVVADVAALDSRVTGRIDGVAGDVAALDNRVTGRIDGIAAGVATLDARLTVAVNAVSDVQIRVAGTEQDIAGLGGQVAAQAGTLADHAARSTVLEGRTPGGGGAPPAMPLRYADAGTPGIPNGGAVADDAVLVGASGGPVRVHNVAAGQLAAGSTDAVNGGQLFATNQLVQSNAAAIASLSSGLSGLGQLLSGLDARIAGIDLRVTANTDAIAALRLTAGTGGAPGPVRYADAADPRRPNDGTPRDDVTLVGASGGPVRMHNVAAGRLEAGSTEAVNGGQLYSTNQAVAAALATADEAVALGRNSVQYDASGRSVTFATAAAAGAPVLLQNVAAGVAVTDAVNVGQLDAGLAGAVGEANAYTDLRIAAISGNLGELRRDLNAGTANALAAAALPQAADPGRGMLSGGTAYYQGQGAFALGLSARTDDGRAVFRAGASVDTRGRAGVNAGAGIQF